jgi:hypothetical protein
MTTLTGILNDLARIQKERAEKYKLASQLRGEQLSTILLGIFFQISEESALAKEELIDTIISMGEEDSHLVANGKLYGFWKENAPAGVGPGMNGLLVFHQQMTAVSTSVYEAILIQKSRLPDELFLFLHGQYQSMLSVNEKIHQLYNQFKSVYSF